MPNTPEYMNGLLEKLDQLSAISGVRFRWKVRGELLLPEPDLPRRSGFHDEEPLCSCVKDLPEGERKCILNDSQEIMYGRENSTRPFVKRCHAGACEIIVPVIPEPEAYPGVVMIGPFRRPESICAYSGLAGVYESLPVLTEEKLKGFADIVPLIFRDPVRRAYIEESGVLPSYPADERLIQVLGELRKKILSTPDELADKIFVSKSRLFHLFRSQCGISLGEYILKVRLREARRYLLYYNWPINRIADLTGFSDQSHFTAYFRREYGFPPLKYRAQYQKSHSG